jgi:hypothetical protein
MTGDGRPEWVFVEGHWVDNGGGSNELNRTLIVEGFDIPWDDPSKW